MGIHDGHRERLRNKFTECGMESLTDVNALEMLLFYSIPRKDTNEIAHKLIDTFGGLPEVFAASIQELMAVPGISYNSAVLISMVAELNKKAEISKTREMKQIKTPKEASKYLIPRFMNEQDEVLLLLCLDSRKRLICCKEIARGTVNRVEIDIRQIVEAALKAKSSTVIISHNHPGGTAMPSIEDEVFTQKLCEALKLVNIELDDHIVVAGNIYASLAEAGILSMLKRKFM